MKKTTLHAYILIAIIMYSSTLFAQQSSPVHAATPSTDLSFFKNTKNYIETLLQQHLPTPSSKILAGSSVVTFISSIIFFAQWMSVKQKTNATTIVEKSKSKDEEKKEENTEEQNKGFLNQALRAEEETRSFRGILVRCFKALLRHQGKSDQEINTLEFDSNKISVFEREFIETLENIKTKILPDNIELKKGENGIYSITIPENTNNELVKTLIEKINKSFNDLHEKLQSKKKKIKKTKEEKIAIINSLDTVMDNCNKVKETLDQCHADLNSIKNEEIHGTAKQAITKVKESLINLTDTDKVVKNNTDLTVDNNMSVVYGKQYTSPTLKKIFIKLNEKNHDKFDYIYNQLNFPGMTATIYRFVTAANQFNNEFNPAIKKIAIIFDTEVFFKIASKYANLWHTILIDKAKSLIDKYTSTTFNNKGVEVLYFNAQHPHSFYNYIQQNNISENNPLLSFIALGEINFKKFTNYPNQVTCPTETLICAGLNNNDRGYCEAKTMSDVFSDNVKIININTDSTKRVDRYYNRDIKNTNIRACINVRYNNIDNNKNYHRFGRDDVAINFLFDIPKFNDHIIKSQGKIFDCNSYCYTQGVNKLSWIHADIYDELNGKFTINHQKLDVFLNTVIQNGKQLDFKGNFFGKTLINNTININKYVDFKRLSSSQEENREYIATLITNHTKWLGDKISQGYKHFMTDHTVTQTTNEKEEQIDNKSLPYASKTPQIIILNTLKQDRKNT